MKTDTKKNIVCADSLEERIETKRRFIINVVYIAIILALVYCGIKYLAAWLAPFVVGFICSLVLQKPVRKLSEKTKIPKGIWSAVLVTVILSIVFALLSILIYAIYGELASLAQTLTKNAPSYADMIVAWAKDISQYYFNLIGKLPVGFSNQLGDALDDIPGKLLSGGALFISDTATSLGNALISDGPGILLLVVVSIVACCFMTSGYKDITTFVLRQFKPRTRTVIFKTKTLFMENILKMLRGYIIILGITFIELFFGLLILGYPYAAIIALLTSFVDILPVLGTGTVLIPWAIVEIIIGHTFEGIGLIVVYAVITIVRNIIEPKIIGKQVGLSPIVTLMSMYLGLNLFGLLGLFIFPIAIIIINKLQESNTIHIWN